MLSKLLRVLIAIAILGGSLGGSLGVPQSVFAREGGEGGTGFGGGGMG